MQGFLDDLDRSEHKYRPEKMKDFRKVLNDIANHASERLLHPKVHYRRQPLWRGHYGGGRRNLQATTFPEARCTVGKLRPDRTITGH